MRRIVETKRFKEQCSVLRASHARFDDALDGLRWALKRKPEEVPVCFPDFGGRAVALVGWPGSIEATVYFTILENGDVNLYAVYSDYESAPAM